MVRLVGRWTLGRFCMALAIWVLAALTVAFGAGRMAIAAEHGVADAPAETGSHQEETPNPLVWKTDLAIFTFLVFLILFFVLKKFAWGPISQSLDQRERNIAENIAAAQRAQDEAKEMLGQYEKKLAGAADQVREMLDEARRDAEHTKQQIVAEAKAAARAEQDRAMRDIRTATDAAVKELSERSTDLAIELAGKVIATKLSPDERSRLVQESLTKFAAATPSEN
ncbi:MAG: F0F1 ATP synthase subunit B [Pirellulales bacterium]|nr:F0F1 ATP synthase subunit B [Pirellulales bacterium]